MHIGRFLSSHGVPPVPATLRRFQPDSAPKRSIRSHFWFPLWLREACLILAHPYTKRAFGQRPRRPSGGGPARCHSVHGHGSFPSPEESGRSPREGPPGILCSRCALRPPIRRRLAGSNNRGGGGGCGSCSRGEEAPDGGSSAPCRTGDATAGAGRRAPVWSCNGWQHQVKMMPGSECWADLGVLVWSCLFSGWQAIFHVLEGSGVHGNRKGVGQTSGHCSSRGRAAVPM